MTTKNLYEELGVAKNATADEIKKAYRAAAMKHHPDRGGDAEKFKAIKAAYETLSDIKKRADYDWPSAHRAKTGDDYWHEDILKKYQYYDKKAREDKAAREKSGYYDNNGTRYSEWSNIKVVTIDVPMTVAFAGGEIGTVLGSGTTAIRNVKVSIHPGVQQDDVVDTQVFDGVSYSFKVNLMNDSEFDFSGFVSDTTRGMVYQDVNVSPFIMITGGYVTINTVDGNGVQIRIPEGFQPNKSLKVKERGYWKSNECRSRGDVIVRIIPDIRNAGDYSLEEVATFLTAMARSQATKNANASTN